TVGMVLGRGLLPRLRAAVDDGRGVVRCGAAVVALGAEDAEAPLEARRRGARTALGSGVAQSGAAAGQALGQLPSGLPVLASAAGAPALRGLSPAGLAHREWGDGGGVQDGAHATAEAVGHALEEGRGPDDSAVARAPAERRLARGL